MKKLLSLLLCGVLCLTLSACGDSDDGGHRKKSRAEALALAETVTVKDYAAFTLVKVVDTTKITPSIQGSFYYENQEEGNTYVDVVLDWENLYETPVACDEAAELTAVGGSGAEYECHFFLLETDGYSDLDQYANIDPLTTARLHCVLDVPTSEETLDITLTADKKDYTLTYTLGDPIRRAEELALDTTIEEADYANFLFDSVFYTDDLTPSNTDSVYTHYEIDSPDSTYLVVQYDITNLQSNGKLQDSFVGVTAVYRNKYTYTGFTVVEDEDGAGFSTYDEVDPLTTRRLYCLIKVPKSVTADEVTLTLFFHGKEYVYTAMV